MDLTKLIRPNILTLEPYHSARESIQKGVLLDANENPYPHQWKGIPLNRYPDPHQRRLRTAIAEYLGVEMENVVAGAGSDEVLDWIFKVFCQPGQDQVATAEPTYGMYQVMAQIYGVGRFEFELDEHFDFSAANFRTMVPSEVKVLFLCSPNNPTGNLLDSHQIIELCETWEGLVVVDEAYIEFSRGSSLISELDGNPNLLILRTLSKAFGRAALRLGYAVASKEIISCFLKIKAPYNLSLLTMRQGSQALRQPETLGDRIEAIQKERDRMTVQLQQISGVRVFPSQANFVLFRCPPASAIYQGLLEKGIVARDRSSLRSLHDCIRVSVGTPRENDLFLEQLREILARIMHKVPSKKVSG